VLENFLNKNPNFMLTQTMSIDDVQPIKNVQIESASNYIQFVKMTEHALTPTRESAGSAVLTLHCPYHKIVSAGGKEVIPTDLQIKLRHGYIGYIGSKQIMHEGKACKSKMAMYRSNTQVFLINQGVMYRSITEVFQLTKV